MGVIELTKETLQQKKVNLLGCKMKIYQERMRQIQFLEVISKYKQVHQLDDIYNIDKRDLLMKLDFCEQIQKKVKASIINNQIEFQQLHVDATLPCSIAMSALTNSVYTSCDVWSALNKMAAYNIRQDQSLAQIENSHAIVKKLWHKFQDLRQTDFDKKYKFHQQQAGNQNLGPDELFKIVMKDMNRGIEDSLKYLDAEEKNIVKKEDKSKVNKNK